MSIPKKKNIDVTVVGAGPTGLLIAGDLAEAGLAVTLVERRGPEVSNISRAFGVHARTLELLDARGLAEDLDALGVTKLGDLRLFNRVHIRLDRLPSRFPYLLITPQYNVEKVLIERARKAGVEFLYDSSFKSLRQDGTSVTAAFNSGEGGEFELSAAYLVGADGAHSAVRETLGIDFPGKAVLRSIMLADVQLAEKPAQTLTVNGVGDGFAFVAPFGNGWYRIFAWNRDSQTDAKAPLELDEIAAVTRKALGTDFGMHSPRWISRFHSDERQAERYREGRVFLVGDAAHVHSPAGGQGMNTGMQDAANLSWKLVSVLNGAPEELVDTYETERHPVGREVLRSSGAIIRMAMIKNPVGRALRSLALANLIRIPAVAAKAMGQVSAIGVSYKARKGSHRLVGQRAADWTLDDGRRLYEALRGGKFVALGVRGTAVDSDRIEITASAGTPAQAVLVRPDGHIGWASDDSGRDELEASFATAFKRMAGNLAKDAK